MNEDLSLSILNGALDERFSQAVQDPQKTWTGKVVRKANDGSVFVDILGGEHGVPCSIVQVSTEVGHTVQVRFQDGRAIIVGDTTDPAAPSSSVNKVDNKMKTVVRQVEIVQATKADVDQLTAAEGRIDILSAGIANVETALIGKADIDDLTAANAQIEQLQAADATITGRLDAAEADIDDLEAEDARIGNLVASKADISDLNATNARIGTVEADYLKAADMTAEQARVNSLLAGKATVNDLNAATGRITVLESTKANISDLEANYITADDIEATYMRANMSNSDVAWIQNGVIKDGAISSAMINTLSANKIVGGTADFSKMNVVNLKAENIEVDKINGQTVTGKSVVDALTQHESDISDLDSKLDDAVDDLQDQIDGAIETWTGTEVPTLLNTPASAWTTDDDRRKHVGDVYFVVNSNSQQNGYNYRFTKTGNEYSWQLIKDSDVTNALQRIQTAEGQITQFDSDISTLKTDTGELKTKTQNLETSLGDKVDTTTFNELSSTVDENSASITSMSTVLTNNGLTSSTNITNTVNTVSQTASGNSSKISQLTTTLGTNADGTSAANDVMHRMSDVEQDLDGITTRVSKTEAHIAGDFALSTTGASTTAKTATITPTVTGWTLEKGVSITVRFDKENTVASPTLNVNSTGAKAIRDYAGNALAESAYKWKAGTVYSFTYDGTYWRLQDSLLTSRVTQAESTITQQADQIEAKVSKDGVIAAINLSTETEGGSAAKISADKVNIEGAAIFTSGRLSQTSLNNAYDQNGAASTAVDNLATDLASATGTTVIHGGHIITNTIDADRLNAVDINASGTLTVGAINLNDADTIAAISNEGRSRNFYLEPTYILTTDDTVNAEKNYYTRSVNEDGGYDYTIVENPVDSGLSSYYERISGTPTPPYSIGDTWTPGEGGSTMVCIEAKEATEEYDVADWIPADGTSDALVELSAGIDQARTDLSADIDRTKTNLSNEINNTSNTLTQRMNASDDRMNTLETGVADASAWRNYMHFDEDTGLTIGQSDGDYSQVMDATGTHWRYGSEDAASVEVDEDGKGAMMLARSEVTEQMRVGNYVWFNRGNRLSLRYLPKGA